MANPNYRGPRALSEILGELFTVRGYGRLRALSELEQAWNTAVGEPHCHETQLGEVRRGVLNVTVAHPTLLEELAAFRKPELLQALRTGAPATTIHDIRFRVGPIDRSETTTPERPVPPSSPGARSRRSQSKPGGAGERQGLRGRGGARKRTTEDD